MLYEKYRKLFNEEIGQLSKQGCYCNDWNKIDVIENFIPENLINVHFSGFNRIGCFDEDVTLFGGVRMKTGIFNANLHNCVIESNALIKDVRNKISNCRIGERVVIHNVNELFVENNGSGDELFTWLLSGQVCR